MFLMDCISSAYVRIMELHQLRYVDLVASEASFTAAARRAHVSQSALSTQVAKLEKELGHRLFERGRHGATTTESGAVLVERMRDALRALDDVDAAAAELSGVVVGSVAFGAVVGCDLPGLASGMAAFAEAHPRASLSYSEAASDVMVDDLLRRRLDLALVGHVDELPTALVTHTVVSSPLVAVFRAEQARHSPSVADLVDETLVTLPSGTGVRSALDAAAHRADVRLRPAFEVHSAVLVLELVRRGSGIGVLTGGMVTPPPEGLVAVPLVDGGTSHLSLAHRRDPSPATAALSAQLRSNLDFGADG